MNQIPLFGLKIEDTTLADASARIVNDAKSGVRRNIYFVNAHCINIAAVNEDYLSVLQDGSTLYADGSGMRLAAKLAGFSLKDNVNGTDLFSVICHDAAADGVKLALLGARPGIAERCAENMKIQFPKLDIVWVHDGYFKQDDEVAIIDTINHSGAEILFVAMGVPMQELWIARNVNTLRVPVLLGVGALFDFYSGIMPRAPYWLRQLGLEWLFRYLMEPRRMFMRYIVGNPLFIIRTLFRRLKGQRDLQETPLMVSMKQGKRDNSIL